MGAEPLPPGFWLCLFGGIAAGGVALAALWSLLRRMRVRRARRLVANQSGSTIIEFPFALIVLLLCALLTWQFGFLISSYLVVDYAAFAAVRSAVVVIAEDEGEEEPAHKLKDITLENGAKGDDIEEAAAFVCYPISAPMTGAFPIGLLGAGSIAETLEDVPGSENLLGGLDVPEFASRYVYSQVNTSARVVLADQEDGERTFSGGELLTVEVTHDFRLRIPVAARAFAQSEDAGGFKTPIKAKASMLYEGFTEKVPPGVEEDGGAEE